MDSSLLVPYQHVLDFVLLEQFVIQEKHRTARISEHMLNAFFLQATHYDLCTRQLHDFLPAQAGTL
jgi:hypothetical protein